MLKPCLSYLRGHFALKLMARMTQLQTLRGDCKLDSLIIDEVTWGYIAKWNMGRKVPRGIKEEDFAWKNASEKFFFFFFSWKWLQVKQRVWSFLQEGWYYTRNTGQIYRQINKKVTQWFSKNHDWVLITDIHETLKILIYLFTGTIFGICVDPFLDIRFTPYWTWSLSDCKKHTPNLDGHVSKSEAKPAINSIDIIHTLRDVTWITWYGPKNPGSCRVIGRKLIRVLVSQRPRIQT